MEVSSATALKVLRAAWKRARVAGTPHISAHDLGQAARTTVIGSQDVVINVVHSAHPQATDSREIWLEAVVVQCFREVVRTPGLNMSVMSRDGELLITLDHAAPPSWLNSADDRPPSEGPIPSRGLRARRGSPDDFAIAGLTSAPRPVLSGPTQSLAQSDGSGQPLAFVPRRQPPLRTPPQPLEDRYPDVWEPPSIPERSYSVSVAPRKRSKRRRAPQAQPARPRPKPASG